MNKITFIGDVHGKTGPYVSKLRQLPEGSKSLQLGDMGLGFKGVGLPPPGSVSPSLDHKFIRGNHDSPEKCRTHPNYAGEYGYWPEEELFFLGGAWSIDWKWRVEGISWWRDEELSIEELYKAHQLYIETKPRIVATHEAPSVAAQTMLSGMIIPSTEANATNVEKGEEYHYYKAKLGCVNTRTSQALQQMFEIHQPEMWFFGHYHVTKQFQIGRTKFQCLAELATFELQEATVAAKS